MRTFTFTWTVAFDRFASGEISVDLALVFAIRIGVGRDDGRLARTEFGEIVLIDVELDLKVVEIGQRDDVTFRASIAGKTRRDEFAAFDVALQDGAGDRRADDGVVQVAFAQKASEPSACLTCARMASISSRRGPMRTSCMGLFERRESGDLRVVAGLRVVERLLGHNALLDQRARAIERHAGVLQVGANLFQIGLAARGLFGSRAVFERGQPRFERIPSCPWASVTRARNSSSSSLTSAWPCFTLSPFSTPIQATRPETLEASSILCAATM